MFPEGEGRCVNCQKNGGCLLRKQLAELLARAEQNGHANLREEYMIIQEDALDCEDPVPLREDLKKVKKIIFKYRPSNQD